MLRQILRKLFQKPLQPELLMYRVHLFNELMELAGREPFMGKRFLEIGPKDGLDSNRLAQLLPLELVMVELPEKKGQICQWIDKLPCHHKIIYENLLFISPKEFMQLGIFNLIWCTGVLYHNAEQLRFLRKLHKMLDVNGYLVLESATLRLSNKLAKGNYVEVHYPQTYRNTGSVTHLPSAGAIKCWLQMSGFTKIIDSRCYEKDNHNLIGQRYACISIKTEESSLCKYYDKTGLNPDYCFGDSL